MKTIKCPNCGANIYIEDYNRDTHCEYCDTPFIKEGLNQSHEDPDIALKENNIDNSKRPQINIGLAIFLFILNFAFGMIYVMSVTIHQLTWDHKHHNDNENKNTQS